MNPLLARTSLRAAATLAPRPFLLHSAPQTWSATRAATAQHTRHSVFRVPVVATKRGFSTGAKAEEQQQEQQQSKEEPKQEAKSGNFFTSDSWTKMVGTIGALANWTIPMAVRKTHVCR